MSVYLHFATCLPQTRCKTVSSRFTMCGCTFFKLLVVLYFYMFCRTRDSLSPSRRRDGKLYFLPQQKYKHVDRLSSGERKEIAESIATNLGWTGGNIRLRSFYLDADTLKVLYKFARLCAFYFRRDRVLEEEIPWLRATIVVFCMEAAFRVNHKFTPKKIHHCFTETQASVLFLSRRRIQSYFTSLTAHFTERSTYFAYLFSESLPPKGFTSNTNESSHPNEQVSCTKRNTRADNKWFKSMLPRCIEMRDTVFECAF